MCSRHWSQGRQLSLGWRPSCHPSASGGRQSHLPLGTLGAMPAPRVPTASQQSPLRKEPRCRQLGGMPCTSFRDAVSGPQHPQKLQWPLPRPQYQQMLAHRCHHLGGPISLLPAAQAGLSLATLPPSHELLGPGETDRALDACCLRYKASSASVRLLRHCDVSRG